MKIKSAAVKHPSGKVSIGRKHKDIKGLGKEGFITNTGRFVGREQAGKIAKREGQVKGVMKSKKLHSSNLKGY